MPDCVHISEGRCRTLNAILEVIHRLSECQQSYPQQSNYHAKDMHRLLVLYKTCICEQVALALWTKVAKGLTWSGCLKAFNGLQRALLRIRHKYNTLLQLFVDSVANVTETGARPVTIEASATNHRGTHHEPINLPSHPPQHSRQWDALHSTTRHRH